MESAPDPIEYASWGSRLGALLIDFLVAVVAPGVVLGLVGLAVSGYDDDPATDDPAAWGAVGGFVFIVLSPLYFWLFHGGKRGQTPGKRSVGIAVRRSGTLDRLGFKRAAGRTAAFAVGFVVLPLFLVDMLWPLWDADNQALHDKLAASVVVRTG